MASTEQVCTDTYHLITGSVVHWGYISRVLCPCVCRGAASTAASSRHDSMMTHTMTKAAGV